jgi:hypothetical protein
MVVMVVVVVEEKKKIQTLPLPLLPLSSPLSVFTINVQYAISKIQ